MMRVRKVLLLLVACVALSALAHAAPPPSERDDLPGSIKGLLAALDDPDDEVVALALLSLDKSVAAPPEVRERLEAIIEEPRLKEALKAGEGNLWRAAVLTRGTLGRATQDELPRLVGLLKDENPEVRAVAVLALGNMSEAAREQAPLLIELLKDADPDARAAVAMVLNPGEALALLKHSDREVRTTAVQALGNMKEAAREHVPHLVGLLKDPSVREAAVAALGNMGAGAREHAPRIAGLLNDPDDGVRRAAAVVLGNMGEAAREHAPRLAELLKDPAPDVRRAAAEALGNMGEAAREHIPRLAELLKDPEVRESAAGALGNMGEAAREHIPRLAELLKDPDPSVRRAAVNALGNMGEAARKYTPRLIELLEDEDRRVVDSVIGVLLAWAPLEPQHVAAFVVLAEREPSQRPEGLLLAHMAGGGEPQVERALRWLGGRDFSAAPQDLRLEEARETLRAFNALWPATEKYPGLRDELARQVTQVVYLQQGRWTQEDRALLGALKDVLRPSHPKQADELDKTLGAIDRGQRLKKWGWAWAGHVGFWLLLIFFYPRSVQVQALFFWNPWVRRILGFGYVGLLLTWVPFLRRRLLSPFHGLLLADADLEHFQVTAYFDRSEVLDVSTGQREPLLKALPSLRGQVVLEGASGLGKSMFVKYLLRSSTQLAVYLKAERCKEGVLEAIQAKLEGHARDTTFLRSIIYSGALDIYIDGLNEVAADTRERIVQFVEPNFHGDILLVTQRMEWTRPATARLYELQPLTEEQISEFLLSREPLLERGARLRGEAYREACGHFLRLALSPGQPEEIRQAMLEVLSNPMDLTVVARMLAEGLSPDLFHLREQQYELMARDYREVNLTEFPLEAFSEEAYQMRLKDRTTLPEEKFGKELLRMEAFKMVVCRQGPSPDGKAGSEWRFRHDKIHDFFIAQTFLGRDNPRPLKHMNEPRFRGVYFLLAKLLAPEEAKALQDHLVERAARTRDHIVTDEFVNELSARRRLEQARTQAGGAGPGAGSPPHQPSPPTA